MQLSSNARKAVAAGLTASTLLWSAMLVAPQIASAAVHSEGCLVLSGGTVWMITGGTRRGYTSAEVFQSWGRNFSEVVTATAEDVALPVGPIMVYADGTLVKGPNDPLVYLVTNGQKRPFTSGSVFLGLGFGFANIQSAPFNTFADLPTGANLDSTTIAHPAGVQVISNGAVWWMDNNGRRGFSSAAMFNSYGYMFSHVVQANSYDLALPNIGDVPARASCSGGSNPPPPPVSGSISVMLASDNPPVTTLISGASTAQAVADLAHFAFSGSGAITSLVFERIGVSSNSTLGNVYVFNGSTRMTDSATVGSDNKVTFAGLNISVPVTLAVKADLATNQSGQTVGMKLVSINGDAVSVAGNIHNIASASLATVSLGAATGGGATDPGTGINLWQSTVTVGVRDVVFNRMALRQIGSITSTDIRNFQLQVDGATVATTANLDSNGYVTFSPNVLMKSGTRTVKVLADIIGGSGRTYGTSLRGAYDFNTTDTQFNVGIITATSSSFPLTVAAANVNAGTLTVAKATNSPSTNLVAGGSDVPVGRWTFTAFGEPVKVETLTVGVDTDDTDSTVTFRNVRVLVNGSQVGSTTDVAAVNSYATGQSFTTNFYVYPGTPTSVEVRSDMYDSEGGEEIGAGTLTTPQFALVQGNGNGIPQTSLSAINVPTASVAANQMTIASGSISLAQTSTYPAQTTVAPASAYKIGSWILTGNSAEVVNVNNLSVGFAFADAFAAGDLSNVYFKVNGANSSIKTTVSAGSSTSLANSYSVNFSVPVNGSATIELYADLASGASDDGSADTVIAYIRATGTTAVSGTSVYADTDSDTDATDAGSTGQTITAVTTGSITATKDGSSPASTLVDDSGQVTTAAFNFAAATDNFVVTDLKVQVASCTAVSNIEVMDGSTSLAGHACTAAASDISFSGLNIAVPANGNKVITVRLTMAPIGVGAGSTDSDLTTKITEFTSRSSNGTSDVSANDGGQSRENDPTANAMYAYKAIPTVTALALSTATLSNTTMTIARFTVSSGGGTIAWKQVLVNVAKTVTPVLATPTLWDVTGGGSSSVTAAIVWQNGNSSAATCNGSNTSCEALITVGTNGDDDAAEVVSGSKTYEVRAAVTLSVADDSVAATINRNTTGHAASAAEQTNDNSLAANNVSFVWSDASGAGATTDTGNLTWQKDYLVNNLPISWSVAR